MHHALQSRDHADFIVHRKRAEFIGNKKQTNKQTNIQTYIQTDTQL